MTSQRIAFQRTAVDDNRSSLGEDICLFGTGSHRDGGCGMEQSGEEGVILDNREQLVPVAFDIAEEQALFIIRQACGSLDIRLDTFRDAVGELIFLDGDDCLCEQFHSAVFGRNGGMAALVLDIEFKVRVTFFLQRRCWRSCLRNPCGCPC